MKNFKKIFVLFVFMLLVTGCGEFNVTLPQHDIDCTYYIWNNSPDSIGSKDAQTLYNQFGVKDYLDGEKIPTLRIYYKYDSSINNVWSGDEAKQKLLDSITIELDNVSDQVRKIEKVIENKSLVVKINGQEIRLNFGFSDYNLVFPENGYCPTLYYDVVYENISNTYYNAFSSNMMTGDNLFITTDVPSILPEEQKPENIPVESDNTKYCKFNFTVASMVNDDKADAYFHVYIRKRDNFDYEYAFQEVNDLNVQPDFTVSRNYNLVTNDVIYINTKNSQMGYGNTTIQYKNMSSVVNSITFDEKGNMICPSDVSLKNENIGNVTVEVDMKEQTVINGDNFRKLITELTPYMRRLANYKNVNIDGKLEIELNSKKVSFPWVSNNYNLNNIKDEEIEYLTEQKIKDVVEYCNSFYATAASNREKDGFDKRMYECISFGDMLTEAATIGLTGDLKGNCNILSSDFVDILKQILDIIKIAGPLLALGLGTLEFIKSIVSGDADKGSKEAFKKFSTRLIAAVLLFIIPFILAFLMDIFLGNEDGYNSEDPFCGIVEWEDYNENR